MASADIRSRIVEAALRLLNEQGADAVSTRAVSAAAGVHAPAIYRIFGDKRELMDAVGSRGFASYLERKTTAAPHPDPVDDLRRGWHMHLEFGLENPALYAAIFGTPREGGPSPAETQAHDVLAGIVHRIARAGRLAIPEGVATALIHATGRGTVLSLIGLPENDRDPELATHALEMLLAYVTTSPPAEHAESALASAAVTVRAGLGSSDALSPGERLVMGEWLDRMSRTPE